jgi:hypothetical protein
MLRQRRTIVSLFALAMLAGAAPHAQWDKVPPPAIPRTPDGKPNLSAPAPRSSDGKPDLSGVWVANSKYVTDLAVDLPPDAVAFQPWAKALYDERKSSAHEREDPPANCLPPGVPRIAHTPLPWKIVQTPRFVVIMYEAFNLWRQVFLDGRELEPPADIIPTWLGYSTGKWDGDTLVVDTTGFNGKVWLDQVGHATTDALHVIERFHRRDVGHLDLQITIDDPKAYTRPWTITEEVRLAVDTEPMEFVCNENNLFAPGGGRPQ